MMKENRKKAVKALDWLFQSAYDIQNDANLILRTNVDAIAISDCVVSWAKDNRLETIVLFLEWLHSRMITKRYLLRTTIAYDAFRYEERLQLSNLQKTYIVGGAYVSAYIANDTAEPGMILLLNPAHKPDLWKWKRYNKTNNWEYFWSAHHPKEISKIKKDRNKAKNLEYDSLTEIYQGRLRACVLGNQKQPLSKKAKVKQELGRRNIF
jgi:hypothetical protein